jgi:hypothetical protein
MAVYALVVVPAFPPLPNAPQQSFQITGFSSTTQVTVAAAACVAILPSATTALITTG